MPRSLAGRLLATSLAAILVALAAASLAIGHVLERFVIEGLDQRLDAELAILARGVREDGGLDRAAVIDLPPFDDAGSGWTWRIDAPGGTLRSPGEATIPDRPIAGPGRPARPGPAPFEARGRDGARLHGRRILLATAAGPATIVATGPRALIERPLAAARVPLMLSVGLLGIALAVAVVVQLRLGLRPLARLGAMLGEVRDGRRRHIALDVPSELAPLVIELNALVDANEAGLARARLHVANLAHGLKTPLATLRLDLAQAGRDPDGRLAAQVAALEAQVRHHLVRARASGGRTGSATVPVDAALGGLVLAMARIHADAPIAADVAIAPDLAVRCDPQDFDEALGNLLDNGWRHARTRIAIGAAADGRDVTIRIADDGDPVDAATLAALRDGEVPADQRVHGHGQGVRIARELIELHGGTLDFARADPAGLIAIATLPAAVR